MGWIGKEMDGRVSRKVEAGRKGMKEENRAEGRGKLAPSKIMSWIRCYGRQ